MPSGFLSEAERERLDGFPAQIVPGDIETYFTLSRADRAQIPRTTSAANRLGFALQLGTLRFLGFCPDDLRATPDAVVTFVAEQLDVAPSELARYGRRGQTRTEHLRQIRRYLRFRKATANDLTIFPHGLTAFPSRGPFRFPFRDEENYQGMNLADIDRRYLHTSRGEPDSRVNHVAVGSLPHFVRVDARTPGAGIHSLRKTVINDAIRNGAQMHEVRRAREYQDHRALLRAQCATEACLLNGLSGERRSETPHLSSQVRMHPWGEAGGAISRR